MIAIVVIFAFFVFFPEIIELIAASVISAGGWFLAVLLIFLVAVMLISGLWPIFHWIAVFLGPEVVEEVVTPLIGLVAFLGPIIGLFDAMTGWPLTKAAYYWTTKLFQSKTWTRKVSH